MTKFNLNNDQVSKLYQVKNIESQDDFLLLLENALVDSSRRICTSRKKNTLAKTCEEFQQTRIHRVFHAV